MKAVFTAAALLATLAAPAAFAGTRDNPHPMKEAPSSMGDTMKKPAPAAPAKSMAPASKTPPAKAMPAKPAGEGKMN